MTSNFRRRKGSEELRELKEMTPLSTNDRGKHAELLAATALLANGYSVLEPISPQSYDLAIRHPATGVTQFVQVKTAFLRDSDGDVRRYGRAYLRVPGTRSNGEIYRKDEVDLFAAVWDGEVYLFPNREKSEYWARPDQLSDKWTKLERGI